MRLATAIVAAAIGTGHAQIYRFDNEPVPGELSLHSLYAFYVYSYQDAPEKMPGVLPSVTFQNFSAHSTSASEADADLRHYHGIQVTILPYRAFFQLINPKKFCTGAENTKGHADGQLLVHRPPWARDSDVSVSSHTVRFPAVGSAMDVVQKDALTSTGVYILVFSNCGSLSEATVSGSLIVQHAYGFLPGNEYYKMPFYAGLLLAYACLAAGWAALCLEHRRELFRVQYSVAVVIILGLAEALAWRTFFREWNNYGERGKGLFIAAIMCSVVKSVSSYMLFLVMSLGWGFTRPQLDHRTVRKVLVLSLVYIVLNFIRECVLSFRHSHKLSTSFVLLVLMPAALLNQLTLGWIVLALRRQVRTLADIGQHEKLQLFLQLRRILAGAIVLAGLIFVLQVAELTQKNEGRWRYRWLLSDGMPHVLDVLVLVPTMYLWAPHTNSQRHAWWQQERTVALIEAGRQVELGGDGGEDDGNDDGGGGVLPSTTAAEPRGCVGRLLAEARGICAELSGLSFGEAFLVGGLYCLPCLTLACCCRRRCRRRWGGRSAPQPTGDVALRSDARELGSADVRWRDAPGTDPADAARQSPDDYSLVD